MSTTKNGHFLNKVSWDHTWEYQIQATQEARSETNLDTTWTKNVTEFHDTCGSFYDSE